jgi:hypothetical protein
MENDCTDIICHCGLRSRRSTLEPAYALDAHGFWSARSATLADTCADIGSRSDSNGVLASTVMEWLSNMTGYCPVPGSKMLRMLQ